MAACDPHPWAGNSGRTWGGLCFCVGWRDSHCLSVCKQRLGDSGPGSGEVGKASELFLALSALGPGPEQALGREPELGFAFRSWASTGIGW